jgi:hypothetical protein
MTTIGDSVSRIRNVLKAVKEDPFMTDRFIYSLLMKYAKTLIKREADTGDIYKYRNLFTEIPCLDLIEVDKAEACCIGIKTGCTFMRSREKLPELLQADAGPVIRAITSLDYSQEAQQTYPTLYTTMTKTTSFKYNKTKYYWYLDGYIYLPNVTWEGARVQAIFEDDTSALNCAADAQDCIQEQDRELNIPEHLFSEIEQMTLQEILMAGQIPTDGADDSQNVLR